MGTHSAALHRPGPVTRFPRLLPATTIHHTTLHHWAGLAHALVTDWFPPDTDLLARKLLGYDRTVTFVKTRNNLDPT